MKYNQASSTAFSVLQGILYVAQSTEHNYLVSDDIVSIGKQILNASPEGKKRLKRLQSPLVKLSVKAKEYLLLPGITRQYILRKRYIEDQTLDAIARGVTQVVNLGAGFDTLAWLLHRKHPKVNFIEIDHPQTQCFKKEALLTTPALTMTNMHFISVDFEKQDLKTALNEYSGFDSNKPTLFICEGVMMYLEEPQIHNIFNAISELTGVGTLLLFTSLEPLQGTTNNYRKLLLTYLKLIGESIKWTQSRNKIPDYLNKQHCELQAIIATDELKQLYIKNPTSYKFHYGEYLVLCRFN